jgi:hypothetical protein
VRFKLDESLSRSATQLFRGAGHDVATVREQQLQGAPDEQVFEICVRERRALVTLGSMTVTIASISGRGVKYCPAPDFSSCALRSRSHSYIAPFTSMPSPSQFLPSISPTSRRSLAGSWISFWAFKKIVPIMPGRRDSLSRFAV